MKKIENADIKEYFKGIFGQSLGEEADRISAQSIFSGL